MQPFLFSSVLLLLLLRTTSSHERHKMILWWCYLLINADTRPHPPTTPSRVWRHRVVILIRAQPFSNQTTSQPSHSLSLWSIIVGLYQRGLIQWTKVMEWESHLWKLPFSPSPPLPSHLLSSGGWGGSDEQVFYSLGPVNGLVGGESVSHAHTLHVHLIPFFPSLPLLPFPT